MPRIHTRRFLLIGAFCATVLASACAIAAPADQGIPHWMKARYESALMSFRQGRVAEAYGRFAALASAGHPAAARHALWMCENGPAMFGRQWDCEPDEILAWAALAGSDPQAALERIHPGYSAASTRPTRNR